MTKNAVSAAGECHHLMPLSLAVEFATIIAPHEYSSYEQRYFEYATIFKTMFSLAAKYDPRQ
ncbi:hypothetical protein WBP07_11320 [Novosphingobium sp. BL-8A]|uniref:hypothetical protein n=1 Tax=Novosphingobium sp. BL-8A TaxID=3127639 RepID=UPI003756B436